MITRILFTFSLSLCITGSVAAQGMQRSVIPSSTSIMQAPTSIMPPPTSLFPTPSLQPSVTSGPRWRSAKKTEETITKKVEDGLITAGDFATSAAVGSGIDTIHDASVDEARALKEIAETGNEGLEDLVKRYKDNPNPNVKKALDDARSKINAEVDGLGKRANTLTNQSNFLVKLGKVLDMLDFVSVAAQGAGYLSVGDTTGAIGVVAGDATKTLSEGTGALVTSFVPGGSVFGSWAGTKFWNLGAYSPAHNKAVLKISSTHAETFVLVDTFSGGPNGTLNFSNDGEAINFQLQNGSYISGDLERFINDGTEVEPYNLTMPISDTSAFADWPKNLQ